MKHLAVALLSAIVDGKPVNLRTGRVVLFFFDPECSHCAAVARIMAQWNWGQTRIIGIPSGATQFARAFLKDTGLRAGLCLESKNLQRSFPFDYAPHVVALYNGKTIAVFDYNHFEGDEFQGAMSRAGFIVLPKK